jgi:hypothetical protein
MVGMHYDALWRSVTNHDISENAWESCGENSRSFSISNLLQILASISSRSECLNSKTGKAVPSLVEVRREKATVSYNLNAV